MKSFVMFFYVTRAVDNSRHLGLKHGVNEFNRADGHFNDTTGKEAFKFFSHIVFIGLKEFPFTSVVLDPAAMLFTTETPNVF